MLRSYSLRCIPLCIVSSKGPIPELNVQLLVLPSNMDALGVSAFAPIRMCVPLVGVPTTSDSMDARATWRRNPCDPMVPTLHDALLSSDAYDEETSGARHSVSIRRAALQDFTFASPCRKACTKLLYADWRRPKRRGPCCSHVKESSYVANLFCQLESSIRWKQR